MGNKRAAAIITLILVAFALIRLAGWLCWVGPPVTGDYGPGENAISAHALYAGVSPYNDFRHALSTPTVYPPIVFSLTALTMPLFGNGVDAALAAGRSVVILSTFVVCIMIFMLARSFGASFAASLIAALAFLCSPLLQRWGFDFRVDLPALAFGLAALWVFRKGYGFAAVLLCVLGFFSKQSSVASIGAIALFLWFEGRRGRAVALASTWLCAVAGVLALLNWVWPHYLLNTFTAVSAIYFDPWAAPHFLLKTIVLDFGIVILAIAAIVYDSYSSTNRLALFFLGTTALENLTGAMRWGSNAYYFLPMLAALAIIAAPQIDRLLGSLSRLSKPAQLSLGAVVAAALLLGNAYGNLDVLRHPSRLQLWPARELGSPWHPKSLDSLRSIRGPVLTDNAALTLVDHSTQFRTINLMILGAMRSRGTFDDTRLLTAIRCHRFAAIALDSWKFDRHYRGRRWFWPELRRTIEANYRFAPSEGAPFLMFPRDSTGCETHSLASTRHINLTRPSPIPCPTRLGPTRAPINLKPLRRTDAAGVFVFGCQANRPVRRAISRSVR